MVDRRKKIGVIGNGVMGSAIAIRLLECGYPVYVRDRNDPKMAALVERGATATPSPQALTAQAEVVITSLNTAEIVETVVFGPSGIAESATPEKLLIDMSSIDPKSTQDMASRLRAEHAMSWVDAPLSGGAPAVAKGALTLMIGGEVADVQRAKEVLADLAANMTHMGPSGAGQTTKLINQVLCAANFLSVAEATRLALDAGVDATKIPQALAGGRADSRILQEYMSKMAVFDYTPTGRIDNMLKDLESAQQFAFAMRTPMPLTSLITDLHRMIVKAQLGPEDSAAYMKLFDFGQGESQ
ncbi:NAD(P)-dependent oxidoreductase [Candidatus Entotheonella palauensis]|uniref:NAD(P)-dependent oxidoreductase n=1 Tax=Candidatus Entotheonella palauensis TaxID=93172 RepID=UPI0005527449|nr:NAD(P)-dependent oxidoreductase [Candidatus Entotheonella palauensis]